MDLPCIESSPKSPRRDLREAFPRIRLCSMVAAFRRSSDSEACASSAMRIAAICACRSRCIAIRLSFSESLRRISSSSRSMATSFLSSSSLIAATSLLPRAHMQASMKAFTLSTCFRGSSTSLVHCSMLLCQGSTSLGPAEVRAQNAACGFCCVWRPAVFSLWGLYHWSVFDILERIYGYIIFPPYWLRRRRATYLTILSVCGCRPLH